MEKTSLQKRLLRHLEETGISVAEMSRVTGVTYDVINKLKHRDSVQSLESGARLQQYLDQVEGRQKPLSQKHLQIHDLLGQLTDEQLSEAARYLKFLHQSAPQTEDQPETK
jgi:Mg2+ and Co2+ transporter CorA